MVTYEAHVEVTIQMPQKCSHQSQIEHMLWIHFKCVLYVITMKLLGSFNQSSQYSQHVITGFRPPHPQWLLLSAHDRYAFLWSPLPLLRDSSVYWMDKPQNFFIHSIPTSFGVWCYFYLHLTHPCSIFVTPLSSDPPLSPIAPLDLLQ